MEGRARGPRRLISALSRSRRSRALRGGAGGLLLGILSVGIAALAATGASSALGPASVSSGDVSAGWQWFKTDFHVHSVISADAFPDLGIISSSGKLNNYNAFFLTDHGKGSDFVISGMNANHLSLDNRLTRWTVISRGILATSTNTLETAVPSNPDEPADIVQLHLAASTDPTEPEAGEQAVWSKRGPNLRSGDALVRFAVHPKALAPGAGLYVSASLGGDPTIGPPIGYTTAGGVISPGKSYVFVWYFGTPPPQSFYPGSTMFAFPLGTAGSTCDKPFATGVWINCQVTLNAGVANVPVADRPLDYNGFTDLKMAAVAAGGATADGFFDNYTVDASAPVPAADEFVYRNSLLSQYNTPTFKIFPSSEQGVANHAQRLNFGITEASQYSEPASGSGVDGIPATQQSGYPAQLNHPGVPGGVTDIEAISQNAYNADTMEVRQANMIADWDAILVGEAAARESTLLVGTWGTDNHVGTWSGASQSSYMFAPTLTADTLIRSFFEGRMYMGVGNFSGRVILNLDPTSPNPYPGRYPVYVSDAQATADVSLNVTAGIVPTAGSVVWFVDGAPTFVDPAAGTYKVVKPISLVGPETVVRAEVRDANNLQDAMTEPIAFYDVPGLPSGMNVHVDGVRTPSGIAYTKVSTRGVTGVSWNPGPAELGMTLDNVAGSIVDVIAATATMSPSAVNVNGAQLAQAPTLAAFRAATDSTWFFDRANATLRLKALQAAGSMPVGVSFAHPAGDSAAPAVPGGLAAVASGARQVDLAWAAAADNVGVVGYTIYRDGIAVAHVPGSSTVFSDTSAEPQTTYSYTLDAYDAGGNYSAQSLPAVVQTPPAPLTSTPTTTTTAPPPPTPSTTTGPAPVPTVPTLAPLQIVRGAVSRIGAGTHRERFTVSGQARPAAGTQGAAARRVTRVSAAGQVAVQSARRRTASQTISIVPRALRLVGFDGQVYVARASGPFRRVAGSLRQLLPAPAPATLGETPAALAKGLLNVQRVGAARVDGQTVERFRASLSKPLLARHLTRTFAGTGVGAVSAAGLRAARNQVDIFVSPAGRVVRLTTFFTATLAGRSATTLSSSSSVALTGYGDRIRVARPRAAGVVSALRALARL
jgi:chitodextrinase